MKRSVPSVLAIFCLLGCSGGQRGGEVEGVSGGEMRAGASQVMAEIALDVWQAPKVMNSSAEVEAFCAEQLEKVKATKAVLRQVSGERNVENTVLPLHSALVRFDRTLGMASLLANVHPEQAVRDAAEACEREAMQVHAALQLDREIYDALVAVDVSAADAMTQRFVRLTLRDYRRAGVDQDEEKRQALAAMKDAMVEVGQRFSRNIREDRRFITVPVERLSGLPADFIAAKPVADGQITLSTDYPDYLPVLSYADDEGVRRDMVMAFHQRAYPVNEAVLKELLELRHRYAQALGFDSWADYNAADKMVKSAAQIGAFVDQVAEIARPRMARDLETLLARKQRDVPAATHIELWDRLYYVEKTRLETFGVDAQQVRAYFPYAQVKEGILRLNEELFQVTFRHVPDAEVWHADVEAYDVIDNGAVIARFYLDMFPRPDKYGHAAMFPLLSGVRGVQAPSASLVCNFPQPSGDNMALMEHNDVETFFHEFGHLMHHLLGGDHAWVSLSGIACEWDFVEVPSQLLEAWAWDVGALQRFARHVETGEVIPADLVAQMRQAKEFGKGAHVMRQMFFAALSLAYHATDPAQLDLKETMLATYQRYAPFPYAEGDYVYTNFGHLEGYSSMYYTYMWSSVLEKDILTRFTAEGLMNPQTAAEYRASILAPGGSVDAEEMVRNFLGRDYAFDAFRVWLESE